MAATEVEDLAALIGIEILPGSSCEEQNVTHGSKERRHQDDQPELETVQLNCKGSSRSSSFGDIIVPCAQPSSPRPSGTVADPGAVLSGDEDQLEEQLSALEKEFAHRYTSRDAQFVDNLNTPTLPPPCVAPWWMFNRGNRSRGGGGQNWGRGRGRGRGYHDNQQHYRNRWEHSHPRSQEHRYQGHHQRDNRRDHYRDREPHGPHGQRYHEPHRYRDRSPVHKNQYY